jgi:hypothetical protein
MENNLVKHENGMAVNMVVSRATEEVKGAIFMSKQFPRDPFEASARINKMCSRKSLAEISQYTYPRGGQKVNGPSIRLAEAIATAWGNIDYGVVELSNSNGLSEMMAYAWDLETNVRRSMVFSVKHERDTKQGKKDLTDNRDIYEITANMGARRVRACILGVIPADVVDEALKICNETLVKGEGKNFDDSVKQMLLAFEKSFKVSRQQIEDYIGYDVSSFDANDLVNLKGVFDAIRDGIGKREDYFNFKKDVVNPFEVNPELTGEKANDTNK